MADNRILLLETFPLTNSSILDKNSSLLTESEKKEIDDNKAVYLYGVFQRAETLNGNNRRYPRHILDKELTRLQDKIKENTLIGELNHPDTDDMDLSNIAISIVKLWWDPQDKNSMLGKAKVLKTRAGNDVLDLLNEKIRLAISSRGMGSLREEGQVLIVEDDFEVLCWDVVNIPSTPGGYLYKKEEINLKESMKKEIKTPIEKNEASYISNKDLSFKKLTSLFEEIK